MKPHPAGWGALGARGAIALAAAAAAAVLLAGEAFADGGDWVLRSEAGQASASAETQHPNECEGIVGLSFGADPPWVRVGGSPSPSTPFVEARGQVLANDEHLNPFVTHTDAPYSHFSKDINVFLTLDPAYRWLLADGNFSEGEEHEHGQIELEWERGGVPNFAWPAPGDRMTVWGAHIFDCSHGDTLSNMFAQGEFGGVDYRTEIHPPVGWVVYRHTADADGVPDGDKRTRSPWVWYSPTDLPGAATIMPASGTQLTTVRATVADAFFSSFGGNAPESLNGCWDDGASLLAIDVDNAPCTQSNVWRQSLLQQDYTFFVPAPPRPAGDADLVWQAEDRCAAVPSSPGNPPGDDVEEVGEAEGDDGAPDHVSCGIPVQVNETVENGQPGIRVTVLAHSSGMTYGDNGYVAFAKRYKVAWDWVPPEHQHAHTFRVSFDHISVYNDSDPCGGDGEWVMSIRVNDTWAHPVRGSGDDGDAFWEDGAVDDNRCLTESGEGLNYHVGVELTVHVPAGEPVDVWERAYDLDSPGTDDPFAAIEDMHTSAGGPFSPGSTNAGEDGAHTITYTIEDRTPPTPTAGRLEIGSPSYGPNADTGVYTLIGRTTPIRLLDTNGGFVQFRFRRQGETQPARWYQNAISTGVVLPFTSELPDGQYTFEYAPILNGIVGPRRTIPIQVDRFGPDITPPANLGREATSPAGAVFDYVATASGVPGPVTIDCTPAPGTTFPLGRTSVSCIATDVIGERRLETFYLFVVDTTPPAITAPGGVTVEATGPEGALASWTASATDLVDGDVAVSCSPASGTRFALGNTVVTCSASDRLHHSASKTFEVRVVDTTPPHITVPADVVTEATGPAGAGVIYSATALDIVDGSLPVNCVPGSGTTFPLGITTVSCDVSDTHDNFALETFTVTVRDTTPPHITVPADIVAEATGPAGAGVIYSATALDIVDGSLPVNCVPGSGTTFPLGITTVSCDASDTHDNFALTTFTVTVRDTTPPRVTVPRGITVNATRPAGAVVVYTVTAVDLVDGAVVPQCSPPSGSTFAKGDTTVSCTASDRRGNQSPAATFVVHVKNEAEQLDDLKNTVAGVGPGTSLRSKIAAAAEALAEGRRTAACNQLNAFANEVRAQSGNTIDPALAADLRTAAARISSAAGC